MIRVNLALEINVKDFNLYKESPQIEGVMPLSKLMEVLQVKGKCEDIPIYIKSMSQLQATNGRPEDLNDIGRRVAIDLHAIEPVYEMDMNAVIIS